MSHLANCGMLRVTVCVQWDDNITLGTFSLSFLCSMPSVGKNTQGAANMHCQLLRGGRAFAIEDESKHIGRLAGNGVFAKTI